ncbi:MAG: outer membrane protein assembly factor BamA [Candidatus Omnitrophica bacterium]|nr:outer membrane protein assembly factor BamA [Candidatus Omnitrophota bacterium]
MRFFTALLLGVFVFAAIPCATLLSAEDKAAAPVSGQSVPDTMPASKSGPSGPTVVSEVEIRGNQIISTNTILSKVKLRKGTTLAQETVNEDLKRLYATGYFQDIKVEVEQKTDGYKIIFDVVEKPVIRQIVIGEFTQFKEDKLRKELALLEGQILDQRLVKEGVEKIRKLYRDKGFQFVSVESEIELNKQTKEATVYIRIVEGEKFKIENVQIDGVKSLPIKKVRRLLKTKKDKWYTSGVFKEAVFEQDLERVLLYFQQEGFLDAKISHKLDQNKTTKKLSVVVVVEEGQHYVAGEIKFRGNRLFPESEISQEVDMLPGLTYSQYYLYKDVEKIRAYYFERGYMEARIVPDVRLNRDTGKVDVLYEIEEGDVIFVDKVIVRGNTKTRDIVIRRELRIHPGERFDGTKIERSKERLNNLGFFEEVTFDTEPGSAPNRRNIIFRVKEKRTGELSFGGGVSSVDQFVGFAEISQKNFDYLNWPRFTGGGQELSLRARVGSISQEYTLSFINPYIFNKPISFGFDIYNNYRNDENVDFDEQRLGAAFTLSKMFTEHVRIGTGYTMERVTLEDIEDDAPSVVRLFEGDNWLSRLKLFMTYDTRDNVFNPMRGLLYSLSTELVGSVLGGDQDYYIAQTNVTKYWNISKKHIFEYKLRLGVANEFGDSDTVPVFDRFYAGGLGTVRGYNYKRISPLENNSPVGGQTLAVTNLEYTFPIPKIDLLKGAAFVDAGQVNPDFFRLGFSDFAVSVGPGLKVKTPLGPVVFYYGLPVFNKDTEDENGRFEFSLSRGF